MPQPDNKEVLLSIPIAGKTWEDDPHNSTNIAVGPSEGFYSRDVDKKSPQANKYQDEKQTFKATPPAPFNQVGPQAALKEAVPIQKEKTTRLIKYGMVRYHARKEICKTDTGKGKRKPALIHKIPRIFPKNLANAEAVDFKDSSEDGSSVYADDDDKEEDADDPDDDDKEEDADDQDDDDKEEDADDPDENYDKLLIKPKFARRRRRRRQKTNKSTGKYSWKDL